MNTALLQDLADTHGTPFYAYDLDQAARQVARLRSLFPEAADSQLYYSFKANPLPSLAKALRESCCEADLTSPGELAAAEAAGFDLSRSLYGGPGKGHEELLDSLLRGVRHFSVESWHDLETLAAAARAAGCRASALLRVNPKEAPQARVVMSGVASQFGFEEEALTASQRGRLAKITDAVAVEGLHIYWGTQIGAAEALLDCFGAAVETAVRIHTELAFPFRYLNLGGGFPWPYAKIGDGPDLAPLRDGLARLHAGSGPARQARWWFESGRYLTAPCGTLVARVMDLKESKGGKRYLILDTGIHHLGGMSGLGRIPRAAVDLVPLSPRDGEMTVDVVGQLCTPLDCTARGLVLPELRPGDLVAIPNVGAYGPTGSLTGFLSRPTPLEIALRDGVPVSLHRLRYGHESVSLTAPTLSPSRTSR